MKILDNVTNIVRDDLKETIQKGSRVSIAAACFSMYAYQELKAQLEKVDDFRQLHDTSKTMHFFRPYGYNSPLNNWE